MKNKTIKCSQVKHNLHVYLDGFLDQEQEKKIKTHLQECTNCRKEVDYLLKTIDLVRNLPEKLPPQDLRYLIQKEIRRHSRSTEEKLPTFKKHRLDWQTAGIYTLGFILSGALFFLIWQKAGISPGKFLSSAGGFLASLFSQVEWIASKTSAMFKQISMNIQSFYRSLPVINLSQGHRIILFIALSVLILINLWFFFTPPAQNQEKHNN